MPPRACWRADGMALLKRPLSNQEETLLRDFESGQSWPINAAVASDLLHGRALNGLQTARGLGVKALSSIHSSAGILRILSRTYTSSVRQSQHLLCPSTLLFHRCPSLPLALVQRCARGAKLLRSRNLLQGDLYPLHYSRFPSRRHFFLVGGYLFAESG